MTRIVPLVLIVALVSVAVTAQSPEPGAELWIDGGLASDSVRTFPDVGVAADGMTWYVWEGEDAFSSGIRARRFAADATLLDSSLLLVNTTTADIQALPKVAVQPDGDAFVVWADRSSGAWDHLRGQMRAAAGGAVGGEVTVNQVDLGWFAPLQVAAAAGPDGSMVVLWASENGSGSDNSVTSVQARLISATGVPTGSQFQVNSLTDGRQEAPDVTFLPDGTWVAVWQSRDSAGTDSDSYSIQMRRFSGTTPMGVETQVNTTVAGSQDHPQVAVGPGDTIAVLWRGPADSAHGLWARTYSAVGAPDGADFRVDDLQDPYDATAIGVGHSVAAAGGAGFLAAWTSISIRPGADADARSIQARLIRRGAPEGASFQVNVDEAGSQDLPRVASRPGALVVTWHSNGHPGYSEVVEARPYAICLFCDDLESGGVGRWSTHVP